MLDPQDEESRGLFNFKRSKWLPGMSKITNIKQKKPFFKVNIENY